MTEPTATPNTTASDSQPAAPPPGDSQAEASTAIEIKPPKPAPEPWTPDRAIAWNAYYDVYVVLSVVLLTFLASSNKIWESSTWVYLGAGREMLKTGKPLTTETFSYTIPGRRWVNIPWLFELVNASIHDFVLKLNGSAAAVVDAAKIDQSANAEQRAAGVLIALSALIRALTAGVLISIRRPGPGAWWGAICAAFVVSIRPVIGPIAGIGGVDPATWGHMLLAIEFLLLHRALNLGKTSALYWLIPLFALWSNIHETFLFGLIVAAIAAAFAPRKSSEHGASPAQPAVRSATVLFSAVACLANPNMIQTLRAAASPYREMFRTPVEPITYNQMYSFFPSLMIRKIMMFYKGDDLASALGVYRFYERRAGDYFLGYYLIFVGIGLLSFALNRRRFRWDRLLTFAVAAFLWGGLFFDFQASFGVTLAVCLILNGQEWYQDRLGVEGRTGLGWRMFSTGGRLFTLLAAFALIAKTLTGYGDTALDPAFGFGFDPDDFAFESASFLADAKLQGNVLNLSKNLGDTIIWRTKGERKVFIDGRTHLYPSSLNKEYYQLRSWLRDDARERWAPLLDRYGVSTLMVRMDPFDSSARGIYDRLSGSPNWVLFGDLGNVAFFGRKDSGSNAADADYFRKNQYDSNELAYRREQPFPPFSRPPLGVNWVDKIYQTKSRALAHPRVFAAKRRLEPPSYFADAERASYIPEPAQCFLAIREARKALAVKPDDTNAFRELVMSYRYLIVQETALLRGIPLRPENAARIFESNPPPGLLAMRFRQWTTALFEAIRTTPAPTTPEARRFLAELNLELYRLYLSVQFTDLARDRLKDVMESATVKEIDADSRKELKETLAKLNEQISLTEADLTDRLANGPLDRAQFALAKQAPGLAILEIEEAEQQIDAARDYARSQLIDLYNQTGQAHRSFDLIVDNALDVPANTARDGSYARKLGETYLLIGNYQAAVDLWGGRAIPTLRRTQSESVSEAGRLALLGDAYSIIKASLEATSQIGRQANWEYDLGTAYLEAGKPKEAADHLTRSIELAPKLPLRPIVEYYLEKLGKPIPQGPGDTKKDK